VAGETLSDFIRRLGRSGGLQSDLAQTDAQLLDRFARRRDESAFAALVARHGPMVLSVCRRLLPDFQDAEDAFQAAFLILARKASTIQSRSLLGPWLYGVSWRVAVRLRGRSARRRQRERSDVDLHTLPTDDPAWSDLAQEVHQEVQRLPDAYRSVVILCILEGRTTEEAAQLLGRPIGTIKSRLARARVLLQARLLRRGLTASSGVLGTALATTPAPVSAALADETIRAALAFAADGAAAGLVPARVVVLSREVLRTMLLKKFTVAAVLVLALVVLGLGSVVYQAGAAGTDEAPKRADQGAEKPKGDRDAIQGTWRVTAVEVHGIQRDGDPVKQVKNTRWVIGADKIVMKIAVPGEDAQEAVYTYKLDPTETPRTFDLKLQSGPKTLKDTPVRAIYSMEGDVLKVCRRMPAPEVKFWNQMDGRRPKPFALKDLLAPSRPTALTAGEGSDNTLLTLQREPAEKDKRP